MIFVLIYYPTLQHAVQTPKLSELSLKFILSIDYFATISTSLSRVPSSVKNNICSDQSNRMHSGMVERSTNVHILSGNVLMLYLHNLFNAFCFGQAFEANFAPSANITSDFLSYAGASGFLRSHIFYPSLINDRFDKFSVKFLPLSGLLQVEQGKFLG